LIPAFSSSSAYRPGIAMASMPITTAMRPTITDWIRQVPMMIFFRSWRSTKTPASNPTMRFGIAVTISVSPTARAELVSRKT
jgi:hypothetical protein